MSDAGATRWQRCLRRWWYACDWMALGFQGVVSRLRAPTAKKVVPPPSTRGPFVALSRPHVDMGRLPSFESVEYPEVSIVIPVYGECLRTVQCLRSISQAQTSCSFEVIVVDDGSPDDTAKVVAGIAHVHLHRMPGNHGFVHACNAGAALARGRFVVFLNNDTLVEDHWLDALLDCFREHPHCGLAGVKLILPDGSLQEAGGIVFCDGNACNYGRGGNDLDTRFNYAREVDYCSGACIALPKAVFDDVGGFDERFAPAYYEDTDLAFAVRAIGLEVWYQPRARVWHEEGATAGRDVAQGVKRYQTLHRRVFVDKWKDTLRRQPDVGALSVHPERCATHHRGAQILIVDQYYPHPDRDSGSVRAHAILCAWRGLGYHVTFWPLAERNPPADDERLQDLGVELAWSSSERDALRWWRDHGDKFDLVVLSRFPVAQRSMRMARRYAAQAPVVFDTVDLHYLRLQRRARIEGDTAAVARAEKVRRAELGLVRRADMTLVVGEQERELLDREVPEARVLVLSNIQKSPGSKVPFGDRQGLLFLGNFRHQPNVDAVKHLCMDIMPGIRKRLPGVVLHVVGYAGKEVVGDLGGDDIVVHGYVRELLPLLESVRVMLVPLRYGAGVKGKINMALGHGLPVVTSRIGAEGMGLVDGLHAIIVDGADAFAAAAVEAHERKELWESLARKGLAHARKYYSGERAIHVLQAMASELRLELSGSSGRCPK